jgi:hypothetical protein
MIGSRSSRRRQTLWPLCACLRLYVLLLRRLLRRMLVVV